MDEPQINMSITSAINKVKKTSPGISRNHAIGTMPKTKDLNIKNLKKSLKSGKHSKLTSFTEAV